MQLEFVEDISKTEYEEFINSVPKSHFMQSYTFGKIRETKGFVAHHVGLKKGKDLICTALLLEKKLPFGYCYFYCPRGYVIDYSDKELLKEFSSCLKKYAKKKKAIFIKIDPDIKRHTLDLDGNIIDGENNYLLMDYLTSLGYRHRGFNKAFENEQPRFTFRLDLDKEYSDVYSGFHSTLKKVLNKGNQYNASLYKGDISDIGDFYITAKATAEREGIVQPSIDYYRNFYKMFNDNGQSDLYVLKVNIPELKKVFESKINDLENEIKSLSNKSGRNEEKRANKINDLEGHLKKLNKDFSEVMAIDMEEVVLTSLITVKYKDKMWLVHGGNNSCLTCLNANYLAYSTAIKDAYDEGYKCVDFFGTCGDANPDKSNPIFGIHAFKKRFGGEYIEFIGEYDLVVNKFMYIVFIKCIPLYRKLIRKLKK